MINNFQNHFLHLKYQSLEEGYSIVLEGRVYMKLSLVYLFAQLGNINMLYYSIQLQYIQ